MFLQRLTSFVASYTFAGPHGLLLQDCSCFAGCSFAAYFVAGCWLLHAAAGLLVLLIFSWLADDARHRTPCQVATKPSRRWTAR